ncbi:MAG: glycosyltransferase [Microthrixaceae bacterium]
MRVSVVVPCHNSLDWLPSTVESVLGQSFTDFEVVLVDDGGDDDLTGWVSNLGDDRVRSVRQANGGVASARNRGIAESSGELIALLDSDDLWEPWTLESLVDTHDSAVAATGPEERPVGLTYGWYDVIDEDGVTNGRAVTSKLEGDIWDELVVANVVAVGSALVPAAVFRDIGGPLENRDRFAVDVEDWEFWIRVAASYRVRVGAPGGAAREATRIQLDRGGGDREPWCRLRGSARAGLRPVTYAAPGSEDSGEAQGTAPRPARTCSWHGTA